MKRRTVSLAWVCFILALYTVSWISPTNSAFRTRDAIKNHSISTGCWVAPSVPELLSPEDGYLAYLGSEWEQNPVMDWHDSLSECADAVIVYQYQSYLDADLTMLAYQSSWLADSHIPAPGTPDGTYYWRVKAKDQHDRESDWSEAWLLTVDRTQTQSDQTEFQGLTQGLFFMGTQGAKLALLPDLPFEFEPESFASGKKITPQNFELYPYGRMQVIVDQEAQELQVSFTEMQGITSIEYALDYQHIVAGEIVDERVEGVAVKPSEDAELQLEPIFFGTCSTAGMSCVHHVAVSQIELSVLYKESSLIIGNATVPIQWSMDDE